MPRSLESAIFHYRMGSIEPSSWPSDTSLIWADCERMAASIRKDVVGWTKSTEFESLEFELEPVTYTSPKGGDT